MGDVGEAVAFCASMVGWMLRRLWRLIVWCPWVMVPLLFILWKSAEGG